MKRIIIAGGRTFNNPDLAEVELLKLTNGLGPEEVMIISGGAKGADTIGEYIARTYGTNLAIYPAQWNRHGKSVGYKRNTLMAENTDALLAFWDGKSKGTKHMIDIATNKALSITIIKY